MFYYLETNAISQLGNQLRKIPRIEKCYTSSLAIAERLRGLDDKTFIKKKEALQIIADASLRIDWSYYTAKIAYAYGFAIHDQHLESLKKLYNRILESNNYSQFSECKECMKTLEEINSFTDFTNNVFRQDMNKMVNTSSTKKLYSKNQRAALLDFLDGMPEQKQIIDSIVFSPEGYAGLAMTISGKDPSYPKENAIRAYNGDLEAFFQAWRVFNNRMFRNDWNIKDNDMFDQSHFLYIQDNCAMVSNDKRVQLIASLALGERRSLSIDSFIEKISGSRS